MKPGHSLSRVLLIFVLVLIGYFAVFKWIEHRRVARGPWAVTFTAEARMPVLIVNQPKLDIHDVRIVFADELVGTNAAQTVEFSGPRVVPFDVPFGRCVFYDPLFLPGTVALELYGHEVQLLPRVLTIDKVEHAWRSGETIRLNKHAFAPPGTK